MKVFTLNFAESNGYNIILPNIIDASKTHAGHVHRSARKKSLRKFHC